eukprot:TRINITY_DN2243_c1_g1_i2.p2 TRINITY_DN2243_c1_g1~~TRINITY_DN2243_c1_g1_i2.p2  ORF type:complete len:132 (-),score=28.14 TRINITY_DN2243_c1_g1_i2:50-445(-)
MTDVIRNSKNNLGHCHFKQNELHGLHPGQVLEKLSAIGIEWDDMPPQYKYGSFVKKSQYLKEAQNPITGETVMAQRTNLTFSSFEIRNFFNEDPERYQQCIDFMVNKFTNETHLIHPLFVSITDVEPIPGQ